MANYVFSPVLAAFLTVATNRLQMGLGAALLLQGPPGGGKTSFARALARELNGSLFYYSGSPDKERDLLYEIDVDGVLKRENAWVKGPAWAAFEASQKGPAVLLIDEVDKTAPGFDAFLLRLLEDWTFRSPEGSEISADPRRLAVVLTSNGRRKLRPEVLRRCQRVEVPFPDRERLVQIVRQIANCDLPMGALNLLIRIADRIREKSPEDAPSPKEMALCMVDLINLCGQGNLDITVWRAIAASYLTKEGGSAALDKATGFKWAQALQQELRAPKKGEGS